jgi:septum formation protein
MNLVLASTSPYRAALLARLRVPFRQLDPATPEAHVEGESPTDMCRRLAREKALAVVAERHPPGSIVVGSDQVAHLDGRIFGKPGSFDPAFKQLKACSGRWVTFETAVCVTSAEGYEATESEPFDVRFRELSDQEITRYLNIEAPWDCAGSIKAEGCGIALMQEMRGRDFNTLLGLPLMLLTDMLHDAGINLINEMN